MTHSVRPDLVASYLTAAVAHPRYGHTLRMEATRLVALIAGRSDAATLLDEADRRQFDLAETIALFLRAAPRNIDATPPPDRPGPFRSRPLLRSA